MNLESLRRRLSSDEINALPLCHYEGPIHLVRSLEDWEKALPDLQQEQVLGFDTETRPSFRKGRVNTPSLVQLATARAVYLVQLSWWPFGPELAGLLADPAVIKAGVVSATTCASWPVCILSSLRAWWIWAWWPGPIS